MTLLTPLALLGLLLLPVLVALHLRRRDARAVDTPSLLLWEGVGGEPVGGGSRWELQHILPLVLQALVAGFLVLALAQPSGASGAPGTRVYVVDDGVLMAAADPAPSRLAAAAALVARDIQAAPSGTTFALVAAARARVVVRTDDRALALRRLRALVPLAAVPAWRQALTVAVGLLPARSARLLIVHARGETLPTIPSLRDVSTAVVGLSTDDQAIAVLDVRCTVAMATCDAFASVRNGAARTVRDTLVIDADGVVLGQERLVLPPRSDTDLSFVVPATRHLIRLSLARHDLVAANNVAWSVVPAPRSTTVTVVGDARHTTAVVRALASLPWVHVVTRMPAQFKAPQPAVASPLVLAGWAPPGPLPATSSLLLIDPPTIPGSPAPNVLSGTSVSGEDAASPLLSGVDLTSLDVPQGTGERFSLPDGLRPVVWAVDGPLLAAGSLRGCRIAVLTFDPSTSNLGQLNAFPLLIANILRWSASWFPSTAASGDRVALDVPPSTTAIEVTRRSTLPGVSTIVRRIVSAGARVDVDVAQPGLYTVTEHGRWGTRSGDVAVNTGAAREVGAGAPLDVSTPSASTAAIATGSAPRTADWWPWLGLLAALVVIVECVVSAWRIDQRGRR